MTAPPLLTKGPFSGDASPEIGGKRGSADSEPPVRHPRKRFPVGLALGGGLTTVYLSLIVLIPLAAVVYSGTKGGWSSFWHSVSSPDAWSALKLTVVASLLVALINLVFGTLIAWVLVRDHFPGKRILD